MKNNKDIIKSSWDENIEDGYPKGEFIEDLVTFILVVGVCVGFAVVIKMFV